MLFVSRQRSLLILPARPLQVTDSVSNNADFTMVIMSSLLCGAHQKLTFSSRGSLDEKRSLFVALRQLGVPVSGARTATTVNKQGAAATGAPPALLPSTWAPKEFVECTPEPDKGVAEGAEPGLIEDETGGESTGGENSASELDPLAIDAPGPLECGDAASECGDANGTPASVVSSQARPILSSLPLQAPPATPPALSLSAENTPAALSPTTPAVMQAVSRARAYAAAPLTVRQLHELLATTGTRAKLGKVRKASSKLKRQALRAGVGHEAIETKENRGILGMMNAAAPNWISKLGLIERE